MSVETLPLGESPSRSAGALLLPLLVIVLAGFLSIAVPLPALPLQVHDALGFDPVTVGWVVGI